MFKKRRSIITFVLIFSFVSMAYAFTRDWDESDPIDHSKNSTWPAEIREVMADVGERLTDSFYGFASGETLVGVKNLPYNVQAGDPGATASQIKLYSKDVSAKAELFAQDEDADTIQITTGGSLNAAALGGVYAVDDLAAVAAILEHVYPVGSVITLGVSTNPATLLGVGTWTQIKGKVIVGIDDSGTFDTLNGTGGSESTTLTAAQSGVPAHTHNQRGRSNSNGTTYNNVSADSGSADKSGSTSTDANSTASAASAHTNLQPYIVKYVWERTS